MNLRRFISPEGIRLELRTQSEPEGEVPADFEPDSPQNLNRVRESIFGEITELFELSGRVSNTTRLHRELDNREKRTSSAVGQGVVLPHLRTLQVKTFTMVFGRSRKGLPFATPDDEPARLFFGLAAPPYNDRTYLKVYRTLAKLILDPVHFEEFVNAEEPSEILRTLEQVC